MACATRGDTAPEAEPRVSLALMPFVSVQSDSQATSFSVMAKGQFWATSYRDCLRAGIQVGLAPNRIRNQSFFLMAHTALVAEVYWARAFIRGLIGGQYWTGPFSSAAFNAGGGIGLTIPSELFFASVIHRIALDYDRVFGDFATHNVGLSFIHDF